MDHNSRVIHCSHPFKSVDENTLSETQNLYTHTHTHRQNLSFLKIFLHAHRKLCSCSPGNSLCTHSFESRRICTVRRCCTANPSRLHQIQTPHLSGI
ncbi:hypothetical protein Hanom_Chr04g00353691 [Helianthus anomalus]